MTAGHPWHSGEALVQERRGTPRQLSISAPYHIEKDMPQQHAEFFNGLPYLPLATMDKRGRPWASILVTMSDSDPSIGITTFNRNQTDVVAEVNQYDPFVRALGPNQNPSGDYCRLFAGVGVDFSNRRRNKLAGLIKPISLDAEGKISLRLISDQHLGNCPKYITVRSLEHKARKAELALDSFDALTAALPDASKNLIARASTVFLATKHSAHSDGSSEDQGDMGFNHRGGSPGFVRTYEQKDGDIITSYLVLPDHSGNRFYQSLGNIETDKQVGLAFPDFTTGDVLYITGNAENLYDADAEAIMPRVSLLTRIEVTGAVFVKGALNLRLGSEEQYSPYNPPVRYLRSELDAMGHIADVVEASNPIGATLVSSQKISDTIHTFNFELSEAIETPMPGGFGIFDFSGMLDSGYSHMNEANPQLVNEDFVRTWTLSSAPEFDAEKNLFRSTNQVSVTVKRIPSGLMSNFLHEYVAQQLEQPMRVDFKGAGVGFSCLTPDPEGGPPTIPAKMLWVAGGVGITPFLAMWDGIVNVAKTLPKQLSSDIILVFSGRDDDINVLRHFLATSSALPENLKLRVLAFQSAGEVSAEAQTAHDILTQEFPNAALSTEQRRVQLADLEAIEELLDREIFLCGPDALMNWSKTALRELGVKESKLNQEQFAF
ncbi:MAG: hypothetical protein ABJO01_06275 [Parasphingorhabdus sp.]|uniref:hypothetical protein n=1 Tax=Parasphingorhabdus sp. TaxID=2709688 RepID=UPI00329A1D2D